MVELKEACHSINHRVVSAMSAVSDEKVVDDLVDAAREPVGLEVAASGLGKNDLGHEQAMEICESCQAMVSIHPTKGVNRNLQVHQQ